MDVEVATDMMGHQVISLSIEEKLRKLGCLAWRREGLEDLIIVDKYLKESVDNIVSSDKVTGNGHKQNGTFYLDIRKLFSILRVTKHWHRLHEEVVDVHHWNNQKLTELSGQAALGGPV